jgi:ubiquinone/menaquinone biosynthesis C-methylase UbiE
MRDQAAFWDKFAPRYARARIRNPQAYQATITRTRRHLAPTDRVLEVGAGTSTTALLLAFDVAHITASDLSAAMVDIGRDKAQAHGIDNITILQSGFGDAALTEGAPFDAVLAHNLLHLLPDLQLALSQIHGLLKPGGIFISKTPCLGEKPLFRPLVAVLRRLGLAPDLNHLRIAALERQIAAEGFQTVERLVQQGTVPTLYLVTRRA